MMTSRSYDEQDIVSKTRRYVFRYWRRRHVQLYMSRGACGVAIVYLVREVLRERAFRALWYPRGRLRLKS
jgi:hypothetical protein